MELELVDTTIKREIAQFAGRGQGEWKKQYKGNNGSKAQDSGDDSKGVSKEGRGVLVLWRHAFQAWLCNLAPNLGREDLASFWKREGESGSGEQREGKRG